MASRGSARPAAASTDQLVSAVAAAIRGKAAQRHRHINDRKVRQFVDGAIALWSHIERTRTRQRAKMLAAGGKASGREGLARIASAIDRVLLVIANASTPRSTEPLIRAFVSLSDVCRLRETSARLQRAASALEFYEQSWSDLWPVRRRGHDQAKERWVLGLADIWTDVTGKAASHKNDTKPSPFLRAAGAISKGLGAIPVTGNMLRHARRSKEVRCREVALAKAPPGTMISGLYGTRSTRAKARANHR